MYLSCKLVNSCHFPPSAKNIDKNSVHADTSSWGLDRAPRTHISLDLCNSAEQAPARRAQSMPHWAAQCSYRHTLYWSYVTVSARQGPPWSQIFTSSHVPATTWSPANFNMHHQNLSFASRISSHTFLAAEDAAQHKLTNMFPDYLAHPAL